MRRTLVLGGGAMAAARQSRPREGVRQSVDPRCAGLLRRSTDGRMALRWLSTWCTRHALGEKLNGGTKVKIVAMTISLISGAVGGRVVGLSLMDQSQGISQLRAAEAVR